MQIIVTTFNFNSQDNPFHTESGKESRILFRQHPQNIYYIFLFYCQRCKVDKNVSTQDEFELAPMKKVVTPKVRTVKANEIEKSLILNFQFFRAR